MNFRNKYNILGARSALFGKKKYTTLPEYENEKDDEKDNDSNNQIYSDLEVKTSENILEKTEELKKNLTEVKQVIKNIKKNI
jgi:hypothetical protein